MSNSRDKTSYQSGRILFIVISGIIALMVIFAFSLAWVDSRMLNEINAYKSAGLTDLPNNNADPEALLDFALQEGINCVTIQDLFTGEGDCASVIDIGKTVNDYKSDQSLIWSFIAFSVIALIIVFTIFIHQASSNLRRLGAEGQKFSPTWAIVWFFIPLMNLFQPIRVVRELVKASSSINTKDSRAWQNSDPPDGHIISSWWTLVIFSFLFGPRGIAIFVGRDNIDDWAASGRLLVWADLFQVLPLVLTGIVVYRIQRAQEIKNQLELRQLTS